MELATRSRCSKGDVEVSTARNQCINGIRSDALVDGHDLKSSSQVKNIAVKMQLAREGAVLS